ncbi:MAG: nucleotide sugar dehydrogenase [Lentilitoribacter sp.]
MEILNKINSKDATIGIIGLGYVGLPLIIRYATVGYNIIGFDIDQKKVDKLNNAESYIAHITSAEISKQQDKITATIDFSNISKCDAIIICVPTPLTDHRSPDLSFVSETFESIKPHLRKDQLICLESTTYPGTTEEIIVGPLVDLGFTIGDDFFVIYSPEREDPANKDYETKTIPKVIGGFTPNCLEVGMALYGPAIDQLIPVSSLKVAEMTKLLENIHRAVNIGLINEMKRVADALEIDIFEIVSAAASKPFGFTPYYSGPGIGGHCIPIDPFYLTWKAREYGMNTRFIELAAEINEAMPSYVVEKLVDALNDQEKPLRGSKILLLGVAYKKNVDDARESPSVEIMEILREKGAIINYSDPYLPKFPDMREHQFDLESVPITAESVSSYDAVIVATDHDDLDYELIQQHAALIVDPRGRYRQLPDNVIRA